MLRIKAFIAAMLIPAVSLAEEPVPRYAMPPLPKLEIKAIPAGADDIVTIKKGEEAPFSGQLYSPDTAIRWLNYMDQYRSKTQLLLDTYKRVCEVELNYRDSVLVAHKAAAADIKKDLEARLLRVEEQNAILQAELAKGPKWYNSRGFGITLGVVGTLGITALSIWAISATASK